MVEIRKLALLVEETRLEAGRAVEPPVRRAAALAVVANPLAGGFVPDLEPLMALGEALGELLCARALAALAGDGRPVDGFGKGAVVGEAGEIEHAAAILHPRFGAPVRRLLGGAPALIPSAKKRAGPGAALDVPLGHKDAAKVRSHFDALEVRLADAPHAGEILVALVLAAGGRPLPRVGGLAADAIEGRDGLT